MKKILLVVLLMGVSIVGNAWANQTPQMLVQEVSSRMLAKLTAEKETLKTEPARIYALVDEMLLPHFDFEKMSQMVLAKYWRRASIEQRDTFTGEFRALLVRTYAKSLNEYADQEIIYLPFRGKGKTKDVTVRSEIEQPGSFPIPIDYRLHQKSDEWKVFDIVIDGVSLVTNYRSSFAREIRQSNIDGLIKILAKRNKQAQKK